MREAIEVRRLIESDADLAHQMIPAIKWEGESNEAPSLDSVGMRQWLANPANVLIVAITEDNLVIGFALGYLLDRIDRSRPMLCFYEIVVASNYRRRGIGRQLVEAMKSIAGKSNATKMWVQTDLGNHAARALYQRAGGIESGTPDHVYSWPEQAFSDTEISAH